ncbi:MAG: hypothetical protein AB1791_13930 [Chloroflexota bacterium]
MTNAEKPLRFISPKSAVVMSLTLCLPFLFVSSTAMLGIEAPFVDLLNEKMISPDGYTPTILGRVVMLSMLFCLPVAFLINLLSMVTKAGFEQATPFKPTPTHAIIGMSVLLVVLIALSGGVSYELRPFVTPLGSGSVLGVILFFVGLLALPVAFLLNRLPRFARAGSGGGLAFQPTSMNLIIGAAILLVILMIAGAFILEEIACSSGIPNCD